MLFYSVFPFYFNYSAYGNPNKNILQKHSNKNDKRNQKTFLLLIFHGFSFFFFTIHIESPAIALCTNEPI